MGGVEAVTEEYRGGGRIQRQGIQHCPHVLRQDKCAKERAGRTDIPEVEEPPSMSRQFSPDQRWQVGKRHEWILVHGVSGINATKDEPTWTSGIAFSTARPPPA